MFNNGVTITSRSINCEKQKLAEKHILALEDFQIVNGGQTLRSAYNYFIDNNAQNKLENLRNSKVIVRIFKIDAESESLKNRIAEYTNSQNAISPIDLKSVNQIQIDIERYLKLQGILYTRKSGDVGTDDQEYVYRISMEKFTQILYSSQGYPERVSNIKKRLFSEYYDDIYNDDFKIENSKRLIENYFVIEGYYKANGINIYDQKIFYIIYLMDTFKLTMEQAVEVLNIALQTYTGTLKETRVL